MTIIIGLLHLQLTDHAKELLEFTSADFYISCIYIVIGSQVLYSRWKFITLKVQYTTVGYSSQLF
jgi:hypothetical protein